MRWITHERLGARLYVRKADRRLFMRKTHQPGLSDHPFPVADYRDRNNPWREALATFLGQALSVNAAETVITAAGDTLSALSLTTDPASLPQQTRKAAEASKLVFNVLVRLWDDSNEMIQRSRVGRTFVTFDYDKAFNHEYIPLPAHLGAMKGLAADRGGAWNAEDFDPAVIWQTIRRIQALRIEELMEAFRSELRKTQDPQRVQGVQAELEQYADFLRATQPTIEDDVKVVYKALTGRELPPETGSPAALATTEQIEGVIQDNALQQRDP